MIEAANDFAPTSQPQCGFCVHFRAVPNNLKLGVCRRYPPVAHPLPGPQGGIVSWADFPAVQRVQSCGEYKASLKSMI